MDITRVELLPKKEEVQNEIPLLLERICPSGEILVDILKFHTNVLVCRLLPT